MSAFRQWAVNHDRRKRKKKKKKQEPYNIGALQLSAQRQF